MSEFDEMLPERFDFLMHSQIEHCRNVLLSKRNEYAPGFDVLQNFRKAAHLQSVNVPQAITGMMVKHTVSVYDMIDEGNYDIDILNEKITDHINYLIILYAACIEAAQKEQENANL